MPVYESPRSSPGSSAWRYVLFGCLGLVVLGVVAVGILGYVGLQFARPFMQAAQQPPRPVSPAAVKQQFAGIPIYPGAQLDVQATGQMAGVTQAMQNMKLPFGVGQLPSMGVAFAVYKASALPTTVLKWYDAEMPALGWAAQHAGSAPRYGSDSRAYMKGGAMLSVTASAHGPSGGTMLQLMRMRVPGSAGSRAAAPKGGRPGP